MIHILEDISEILRVQGIQHYIDEQEKKCWDGTYFGIFKHKRCLYFTLLSSRDGQLLLQAIAPRRLRPEKITVIHGIQCYGNPDDFKGYPSPGHYVLNTPVENGLINGRFSVAEKRDFFISVARMR